VEDGAHVRAIPDRRAAIGTAVGEAGDADVVVIAGKGHEATQVVGSEEHPFDDRHVAYEETARMTEARR
jgi:UDP-N-acetylmuramoyl-L-alanyl-D-glutamate--2,6-diaminopimelate ligase